ncbi:MAG: hypothetical protein H0W08_14710, partial [Acidobacteria bacterium]|nr:hypothetical protein [Acidobacteriota bacterium]
MSSVLRFGTYDNLLTAVIFLAIIVTCGLTPMQTDTWWQLRAGQDMWLSRTVLLSDIYSHTAYGSFWLNHEWLADVVFYGTYRLGGLALLTLLAAALIVGGWAVTWRLTQGPVESAFMWTALALVCSAGWWEPRPHAFSLLFLPLTVLLLAHSRHWWLPAVFLVWANCHGGVLLGFVLLGAGFGVQTLLAPRQWWRFALVMVACMVAVTLTPLGLLFWTEIPRSLMRINQYTLNEWMRPGFFSELPMIPFWFIAMTLVGFLARNGRRLLHLTAAEATVHACALALLPGAILAVRNVGPFVMVAVPAITWLISAGRVRVAVARNERPVLNLAVGLVAAVTVTCTLVWAYSRSLDRLRWEPVPAGALAALERCPDNLYNRYDEGGPLLWFAQGRKVFLDGRQDPYPPDLVLEHVRIETGLSGHEQTFARFGIRCAYLPAVSPVARRLTETGWKALYR